MAIEFVSVTPEAINVDFDEPASIALGDLLIGMVAARGGTTAIGVLPDWHQFGHVSGSDNVASLGLAWHVVDAADLTSWFASAVTDPVRLTKGVIAAYRGADPTQPIADFAVNDGTGDIEWLSVDAPDDTFLIGAVSTIETAGTMPSGSTLRWAQTSASGGEAAGAAWDLEVSAGATGLRSASGGTSGTIWVSVAVVLQPLLPHWDVGTIGWGTREAWS